MDSVYILVNKDMPELIKIGRASGTASERAKKLSQSTSVPSPFEVVYESPCDQAKQLERTMHRQLAQYRRPRREFFECSVEYAISLLEHYSLDILNNHPLNQKAKELLTALELDEKPYEGNCISYNSRSRDWRISMITNRADRYRIGHIYRGIQCRTIYGT
ncbi:MAG: GIY-YIG nuclease family protein [Candidatus Poribacteria bacterium]|nr:GIY-YIG nuclease family protein [Candidatus Poribacteria bacterium]